MIAEEGGDGRTPIGARAECFLLCDHARVDNGKLYILGGGWDQIAPAEFPARVAVSLAMKIVVPGELTVPDVAVRIDVLDGDGEPIGPPVFDGRIAGDPRGPTAEGEKHPLGEASILMAMDHQMEITEPGRFALRLAIGGFPVARTSFAILPISEAGARSADSDVRLNGQ